MPGSIITTDFFNNKIILVDRWAKHASNLELLSPGNFLLTKEIVKHLSAFVVFSLLSEFVSSLNVDKTGLLFRELDSFRFWS